VGGWAEGRGVVAVVGAPCSYARHPENNAHHKNYYFKISEHGGQCCLIFLHKFHYRDSLQYDTINMSLFESDPQLVHNILL
jgi:hypothetical protein